MTYDMIASDVPGLGRVAFVLPTIRDEWPAELKDAFAVRRQATITGRCECGTVAQMPSRAERRAAQREGRMLHSWWEHETECPAGDEMIAEIIHRHGLDHRA